MITLSSRRTLGITGAIIAVVIATAIAFAASSTAPREAQALTVGVGDNGPSMFNDPRFQSLGTEISRKILPWDFYKYEWDRNDLAAWMAGAKQQGIEPLIAFNHSNRNPGKLPSIKEFKYSLKYLRKKYPQLRNISPWNEANHHTQPTSRSPKRAAEYYNATRQICRGCKIVAADVLDIKNMIPWLTEFRRFAKKPSIWGLHSYGDTNLNIPWKRSSTKLLLDNVDGKVWLTEVGGLVAFGMNFDYDEARAQKATKRTLTLAKKSPRIERLYFYSWYGTVHVAKRHPYKWDSGLMDAAGKPRPAFYVLRDWLKY